MTRAYFAWLKEKHTIQKVLQLALYFQLSFTNVTVGTSAGNKSNTAKRLIGAGNQPNFKTQEPEAGLLIY